ncbi:DUF1345 domain-containing protein [Parablastomonas sp. CN1-191]|uniref:DUF1345 domain-containing protein n=1 Tax=Parablastomonas sp. CN1-191 TaxID=3400908 RepID=UPI003BF8A830
MTARGQTKTRARAKAGARRAATIGNRLAPPRFLICLVLMPSLFAALTMSGIARDWRDAAALAFDGAALVFLLSLAPVLRHAESKTIREHAAENDANRGVILIVTTVVTLVVMAAIAGELQGAKHHELLAMAKLVVTLVLIWLFANTVYATHYAHAFYSAEPRTGKDAGGLDFPGTNAPDYGDFLYFACTLGMTFQTSDVAITAPAIRRVVLLHSFAAFIFNIGVIAFTINTLGGS